MHLRATLALAGLIAIAAPSPARAVISDVHPIDGPGPDVLAVGDAAMSEDGSGGVVYLKRVDGRAHVLAAQFRDGRWRGTQRVDAGQSFDSSWPRIGAGDGGRLVVTWVQEFGAGGDRMFSAALDPGAGAFQRPVPVDSRSSICPCRRRRPRGRSGSTRTATGTAQRSALPNRPQARVAGPSRPS
ncbi:MAG: hypothetical protein ACREX8_20230 [Gammaproteobacteria bacterium]